MQIIPIILSGGSGNRLWPMSRSNYPKQFLPLVNSNTMLQETILRLKDIECVTDPIIVCNISHRFVVAEQCQQIKVDSPTILLEPEGRNTAPAIVAAALHSLRFGEDHILLVLSADHIIKNIDALSNAINIAKKHAQNSKLVTFGVVPRNANTGFGYIKVS